MDMSDYSKMLVAILAVVLAINLILGVIALTKLIGILNQIKRITDKAENLTDRVSSVSGFFKKTVSGLNFGRVVTNVAKAFRRNKTKKRRSDDDE